MEAPEGYSLALQERLLKAIWHVEPETPGQALVYSGEAIDQLMFFVAFVVHSSHQVDSPTKNRRFCEEFARKLRFRIVHMQEAAARGELDMVHTVPDERDRH